jgi:hypothetical protein
MRITHFDAMPSGVPFARPGSRLRKSAAGFLHKIIWLKNF